MSLGEEQKRIAAGTVPTTAPDVVYLNAALAWPLLHGSLGPMVAGGRPALGLVALLLLAPLLAAVIISVLLLFGVEPHLVFLPGFFLKARIEALGFHLPNPVTVMATAVVYWAVVVSIWLVLRRLLRRAT